MRFNRGARYKAFTRRSRWPVIAITAAFTLLLAVSGFFAWNYFRGDNKEGEANDATSQRILEKVNNLYLSPEGEDPTVAQIKDKDKLKDQPFFNPAQNGDYLLVYTDSQIAMIYREDINKLVTVGPISTNAEKTIEGSEKQEDVIQ